MSIGRRVLDLLRDLCYLSCAILFTIGAIAYQVNPANTYSNPVYVASAFSFLIGAIVGCGLTSYDFMTELCCVPTRQYQVF